MNKLETLPLEECIYKTLAQQQRENEIKRGEGTKGTSYYEIIGCFECSAYNKSCSKYLSRSQMRGEQK